MSPQSYSFQDRLLRYRRVLIFLYHVFAVSLSNYLAFQIRFDGAVPDKFTAILWQSVLLMLIVRLPLFALFGLYKGLWRYAGITDMQKILASATVGTAVFYAIERWLAVFPAYPRAVLIVDWLLVVGMIGGVRFALRMYKDYLHSKGRKGKRVLVIGAGNAGEMLVRDMKNSPSYRYDPVGFIDDDMMKKGLAIHGVPILGTRKDMAEAVKQNEPEEIIIAIPSANHASLQELMGELAVYKLPVKMLPNMNEMLDGGNSVSQIKQIELEDLLARPPIKPDTDKLFAFIKGKSVMVTGAGGSIGSEICRQVAAYGASKVVAYERHENSIYNLDMDFRRNLPDAPFVPVVGDVNDMQRLQETMELYRPDIVFHAAAHKHVPMMELNPREAIKNNFLGTRRVALVAGEYNVGTFVLISTDKAVNPTNIMGATKRSCELLVRALDDNSETKYLTVRFGNVLGSSGSVVPLFREQIARGGPVTVTHPDITRFTMLIPEAVLLVLQAASVGKGGEIFVLDMGEPIRILDLARDMIRLSGFEPDKDIQIKFVGLRPGEKLYEELFDTCEEVVLTQASKVFKAYSSDLPGKPEVMKFGDDLEQCLIRRDTPGMIKLLGELVKTYAPETSGEKAKE
ncbi:MAG: polysaccharide biosynthesis protein [Nitrospirae bacterium]|nr:polysaccharide biosynthesis protein [Nitrospirota bacterium]